MLYALKSFRGMPGAQIDGFHFDVEDAFIELTAQEFQW
jgi:hypothetical protein